MAIKKMNSQEFNDLLENTENKILNLNNNVTEIKNDMQTKLTVIEHEITYLNSSLNKLTYAKGQDGAYILLDNNFHGLYSTFCNNVHPYFKTTPINVFNVKPINSDDIYYKDEAKVSINGVETDHYKDILKEDTVASKKIFFEEYTYETLIKTDTNGLSYIDDKKTINLTVSIDEQKAYGINKFNMIEIDPYLMKSFDIQTINIYDSNVTTPAKTITGLNEVGKTRIILDKKYLFKKVEFIIAPKYSTMKNNVEIIPFGIKHIYFYEADFRNDSYIDIVYESDNYIDYVNNKVEFYTPAGMIESTLTEQGVKIYLDNINDVLGTELEPTDTIRNTIARNIKKLYFRVPIGQADTAISATSTVYGIKFFIENR